jgi:mono/diheme cytochrome c family protein
MLTHKTKRLLLLVVLGLAVLGVGCRYDMQDQPRYKAYKPSEFFPNGMGSRDPVEGTVPRGYLREDKALYTGKKDEVSTAPVQSMTDASGNTVVSSFPNDIDTFPLPVSEELVKRGQERYNIYCGVCHGPLGNGDGMIVRRGFSKPPTYHEDRLRNAPVGHFFDVASNGWGRMNGYASQISVKDRWAIVAYIRALQISQNPNGPDGKPLAMPAADKVTEKAGEVKSAEAAKTETKTENGGGH